MAAALFAFILDWVPAARRGPWDLVALIIPERRGTVEGVLKDLLCRGIMYIGVTN
jgi:hypothetical protein